MNDRSFWHGREHAILITADYAGKLCHYNIAIADPLMNTLPSNNRSTSAMFRFWCPCHTGSVAFILRRHNPQSVALAHTMLIPHFRKCAVNSGVLLGTPLQPPRPPPFALSSPFEFRLLPPYLWRQFSFVFDPFSVINLTIGGLSCTLIGCFMLRVKAHG